MAPRALLTALLLSTFVTTTVTAGIDRDRPSAVGTDDGIRVEARLVRDAISSGVTIGLTYEVENLTRDPIALAPKRCSASYDPDSQTVTISIGSEVPDESLVTRLVIIPSGGKQTFTAGASPHFAARRGAPRYVQITVNVLREWSTSAGAATTEFLDQWLERNATIVLNALPVYYAPPSERASAENQ